MFRKTFLAVLVPVLALALAGCTNSADQSGPLSPGDVVVTPNETIEPSPSPSSAPSTVAASAAPSSSPSPKTSVEGVKFTNPAVAASGQALYRISVACVSSGKRKSGAAVVGAAKQERADAKAGTKLTYSFNYKRDESTGDPVVEWTKKCTMETERLRSGAEPRLSALLSCDGKAQYETSSKPTSIDSRSWRRLADLTKPYTHTMRAPKAPDQISEDVTCALSVVRA